MRFVGRTSEVCIGCWTPHERGNPGGSQRDPRVTIGFPKEILGFGVQSIDFPKDLLSFGLQSIDFSKELLSFLLKLLSFLRKY